MAYPIVSGPYGLKPINRVDGVTYAGAVRQIPIPTGYSNSICTGDVVQFSNGTLSLLPAGSGILTTGVNGVVGVFMGCEYSITNGPIFGKNRFQAWSAGTVAQDAVGYVVDDPRAVFKAVVGLQTSTISGINAFTLAYLNPAFVGSNAYYVYGATTATNVPPTTGDSAGYITVNAPSTTITSGVPAIRNNATSALRIVGVVPETAYTTTATGGTGGSASNTVTLSAINSNIVAGMQMYCAYNTAGVVNAAQGNYVTVINVSGTTITVLPASGTTTTVTIPTGTNLYFVGYPEMYVTWNVGFHSYNNATGV